jgi:pimeloyl-ACP methyl ester carboxylesterase
MMTMGRPRSPNATTVMRIPAAGGDGALGLLARECVPPRKAARPVLLVHGATLGAALFDLPLAGYSLLDALARTGRSAYAVDIRGYGHSLDGGGDVMNSPPTHNPPFAALADAVTDVSTAVSFIRQREQVQEVDLVGFSWGTVVGARFAGEHAHHVGRLALYAPLYGESNELWLQRIGSPGDPSRLHPDVGAYRSITEADLVGRWDGDIGPFDPSTRREAGLPRVIFDAFAALDPQSHTRNPPSFRAPAGALEDLIGIFNGQPLYDPGKVVAPTLLVRGSDDTTSTASDMRRLADALGSSRKVERTIVPGSHFLCVERNRMELYRCLCDFLAEDDG